MTTVKLSVSDLDQLIWYQRIESMTPDELVRRFRREEPPPPEAMAGRAWHKVLENHEGGQLDGVIESDGFTFTIACDAAVTLPHVKELGGYGVYEVGGVKVILGARCDGITGSVVTEYKLTGKINPMSMIESYQWKAYLDIWSADAVDYGIFQRGGRGFNLKITDYFPMRLYRYSGMRADLHRGIRDYLEFASRWMPEIFNQNYQRGAKT